MAHEEAEEDVAIPAGDLFPSSGDDEDPFFTEALPPSAAFEEGVTLKYTLAPDPSNLFNNAIWGGTRAVLDMITAAPDLVRGKTVLEFGAGAGLPSIVCSMIGAKSVVASDVEDALIQEALCTNVASNPGARDVLVRPHMWGAPTDRLLEASPAGFDVLLLCDVLWLHPLHDALLRSVAACLAPAGVAYVAFSHHVPGQEANDLGFFDAAKGHGLESSLLHTATHKAVYSDKLKDVFVYSLHVASP